MSTSCSNLDTKVCDIVNSYRSVDTLPPVVSKLCQLPEFKQTFWHSLNQDLHVICQRSQTLAHGEITVFQRAFAVLMQKKEDIIPAINFYVDEMLGLKFVSEPEEATILSTMIQTRHSILGQGYDSKPKDLASRSDNGDEKLKRLFVVYHKAKKDFDATTAKTIERTKSAKFLRDTTENCLAYIAVKQTRSGGSKVEANCDGKMLNELRATLEETTAIAEQGSGGKKRRFDENWENVPQEPAKMRRPPGTQPFRTSDPIPRGRISHKKQRAFTIRTQERQALPEAEYPKKCRNLAERSRSDLPNKLYRTSTSQSVRRVLRDRYKPYAESSPSNGHVHGDRYRPAYS